MIFVRSLFRIIVTILACASAGKAELNGILFRGISQHFKPEYVQYSPVVGKVALERGLIYNLRFFGDLQKAIDPSTGRRFYTSDKGNDPSMQLMILLFPSSAGGLASSSEAASNFGKHATPEMVASLLNYADSFRKERENQPGNSSRSLSSADFKKKITEQLTHARMGNSDAGKVTKNLSTLVKKSIDAEQNPGSFYPAFTTEQIILSFFCKQFNTKRDIWRLLHALNPTFLKTPIDESYLNENSHCMMTPIN